MLIKTNFLLAYKDNFFPKVSHMHSKSYAAFAKLKYKV